MNALHNQFHCKLRAAGTSFVFAMAILAAASAPAAGKSRGHGRKPQNAHHQQGAAGSQQPPDQGDAPKPPRGTTPPEANPPAATSQPQTTVVLSNETTHTVWANALVPVPARATPSFAARETGSLSLYTEDNYPEVYVVLAEQHDATGQDWVQVRLPGRPNGQMGWVQRSALGAFRAVADQLVLDTKSHDLSLLRAGRLIFHAPAGVGKASTPTPRGHFWIREKFRVPANNRAYGPWAFGTSAYSALSDWLGGGVVGIHGTDQPQLIPGGPSHGCVRLRNGDVKRLARLLGVGTPLLVR